MCQQRHRMSPMFRGQGDKDLSSPEGHHPPDGPQGQGREGGRQEVDHRGLQVDRRHHEGPAQGSKGSADEGT